jgi:CHAT domain-containing protein
VVEGATTDSFKDAFRASKYDILHMVCHGEVAQDGTGNLLFQDIKGRSKESISASTLGMFLKDKELRVVVLSACNTAAGDFAKEFAVVAKTLVESGIPAVVANQFEIQNSAAATFADAFYSELLDSGDIDRATTKGRMSLGFGGALPNNVARIDWGIPSLYRHLGGARAFKS